MDKYINLVSTLQVCLGSRARGRASLLVVHADILKRHMFLSQLIPGVSRVGTKRERWGTTPNLHVVYRSCVSPCHLSMARVTCLRDGPTSTKLNNYPHRLGFEHQKAAALMVCRSCSRVTIP